MRCCGCETRSTVPLSHFPFNVCHFEKIARSTTNTPKLYYLLLVHWTCTLHTQLMVATTLVTTIQSDAKRQKQIKCQCTARAHIHSPCTWNSHFHVQRRWWCVVQCSGGKAISFGKIKISTEIALNSLPKSIKNYKTDDLMNFVFLWDHRVHCLVTGWCTMCAPRHKYSKWQILPIKLVFFVLYLLPFDQKYSNDSDVVARCVSQ